MADLKIGFLPFPEPPEEYDPSYMAEIGRVYGVLTTILNNFIVNPDTNTVELTDPTSANPAAISGKAILYVDASDGDLKIRFGDGTIKTITADT
jgi:hypothetical protein|tara:strand:- start:266 stop:547 length:282 start_codon:yes stop_codon:yes gene_type:complete